MELDSREMKVGLGVGNVVILMVVVFPLCMVSFWNKMGIKEDSLSYCSVVNMESLTFIYLPLMIVLRVYAYSVLPYFNIVFLVVSVILFYVFPLLSYHHSRIHTVGSASVVAMVGVMSCCQLIEAGVDSFGRVVVLVVSIGVGTVVLCQLQLYRMRVLLTLKPTK